MLWQIAKTNQSQVFVCCYKIMFLSAPCSHFTFVLWCPWSRNGTPRMDIHFLFSLRTNPQWQGLLDSARFPLNGPGATSPKAPHTGVSLLFGLRHDSVVCPPFRSTLLLFLSGPRPTGLLHKDDVSCMNLHNLNTNSNSSIQWGDITLTLWYQPPISF